MSFDAFQKHPYITGAAVLGATIAAYPVVEACVNPLPECGMFTCSTPDTVCTTARPYIELAGLATAFGTGVFKAAQSLYNRCKRPKMRFRRSDQTDRLKLIEKETREWLRFVTTSGLFNLGARLILSNPLNLPLLLAIKQVANSSSFEEFQRNCRLYTNGLFFGLTRGLYDEVKKANVRELPGVIESTKLCEIHKGSPLERLCFVLRPALTLSKEEIARIGEISELTPLNEFPTYYEFPTPLNEFPTDNPFDLLAEQDSDDNDHPTYVDRGVGTDFIQEKERHADPTVQIPEENSHEIPSGAPTPTSRGSSDGPTPPETPLGTRATEPVDLTPGLPPEISRGAADPYVILNFLYSTEGIVRQFGRDILNEAD